MLTLIRYTSQVYSFLSKILRVAKQTCKSIKQHYVPIEEHQITYTFNDTMRHCPKNADDLIDIYVIIHKLFKDIEGTPLFRSLINEMAYANLPSCKPWESANVGSLPNYLDAPFSNIITNCADRITITYWVLWYDNHVEVIQPHQNRGIFRTGREIVTLNDKPDCMPENVIAAAQVTLGVVQAHHNTLRGFQWKLYR